MQGAQTHCSEMPGWDGCTEEIVGIVYILPEQDPVGSESEKNLGYVIRTMSSEEECEQLAEESHQKSCQTYHACYSDAIGKVQNKVSALGSAKTVAAGEEINFINDNLRAAKSCHANFLASLDPKRLGSDLAGENGGGTPDYAGPAVPYEQATDEAGVKNDGFEIVRTPADDFVRNGRSRSPGGSSAGMAVAAGGSLSQAGESADKNDPVEATVNVDQQAVPKFEKRRGGGVGQHSAKKVTPSFTWRGKNAAAAKAKNNEISFAKNGKNGVGGRDGNRGRQSASLPKPELFQMISTQYTKHTSALRTLDSYIRETQRQR